MEHVDKSQPNQAQGLKKPKRSPVKKKQPLEKLQSQGLTDQASDEKFQRLFEAARDGILLLDAGTGEITDANPFIEAILGCSNKELIGRKLWEIGEFKEIAADRAAFTILQKKPSIHYRDLPLVTRDGKRRNVEFISNVYRVGRQKIIQCNFRDITESKLAVNSLAESEERYRDLFDNASLGIFKTSANGRIIVVNRAFARMFGYGSPEEFKSLVRNAADVFADPQRRAEIIQLKAEHPELTSFENLYRRKDGSTFFGSLTVRQGSGRDGQETLFEGFIEDISERKRAERALRESELKSRIIFENSTAGVALVGLDSKYLMVNPAFCEIHGYSAEELLKMNFFQVTHPDDIELSRKTAEEVARGGSKSTRFFKRYIHKDGHTIWAEVSSALVHGMDGQPEYFITHVIDITERKRMEEALRKSETELRALIEEIPAIIYTELADEPGITLYISPQIEAITGYTPAEWMASTNFWDEIVHPEDLDYLHAEDERTNRTGEPFHAEYRILKRDGSEIWMLDEAVLIQDGAGKGLFWQGIMHDISDKKRAEKAQRESEERYQLISTVASDYMFYTQLDDDGSGLKLNWVAGAFEAITGYTKEEYIARGGWRSTLHPDDLAIDNRDMENLRAGQPVITEIRTFTKAGNIVWVRVYAQPVLDESHKELVSIYGAVQDITERKRAEASLQLSLKQAEHNRGMLLALNQAGQAVQRARSPEEVYISIQEQMKHLGFTATVVELKDPKDGLRIAYLGYDSKLVRMAEKLTGLSMNNFRFHPRRDSIFQRVLEQGETMHVADATQAVAEVLPEKLRALAGPTKEMLHLEQATFAPLTVEGKATGVLVVTGSDLSEEDNTAVTAFANQAAIAIENASLYEKIQKELAERKRVEQSLADERNLLRTLVDNVPDFIYAKDSEARFVLVNMACVRGAGYSKPEEALGKTDFDYYEHELAARYFADDQKVLQAGQPLLQHEEPSVDADGNQLWLSTNKVPLRDSQGKIYGLVGTGRDITEHKRAEAELQASREAERDFSERLTILSETTTELSKADDLDMLCRRAVELGRDRLGFDRLSIFFLSEDANAILGTFGVDEEGQITDERGDRYPINSESHMWSILHSQVPMLQLTEAPLYLRGQVIGQGMHVFAGLWDGNKVIGSITLDNLLRQRPFSDRDCEIIRLFASAVGHLISLKRTQEGLHASEERFAKSFQVNPLPICISAFPEGRMVEANEAFLQLTGYTRSDVINHSGPELELWVDSDMRATMARELLEKGSVRDINGRLRTKTGQFRDILASAGIIQLSEQPHALIMLSDITESKQTQVLQEAVYRIAAATETTSSLDELYPQIHQIISSVMPAENFYIALYDEAEDLLRFSYFRDAADEPFMGGIQPGKGLTSYVLRTGKALLCTQAVHDELERRGEVKLLGVPSAIWLGVPLIVEGKTIGAMVVQHYTDPKAYREREQHMLEFVSTQVAIAINRKRAETELQASREAERSFAERLTILSEVTTELSKAEDLDTLCRQTVELGRERLDFDRLAIWFLTEDLTSMVGTFGVDAEGRYTDEREQKFPISADYPNWSVLQGQVPLLRLTDTALSLTGQVVGQGMHVSAGLWDGKTVIGYLSLDNLLRQRPFSDQDCEIIRLFASAVGHLISLKRAQEGLRASEERYRMLFELSPDSIAVHQDGKVIITNRSAVKLLGASGPEEVIGRPVMDLVHPDYHKIVIERTRQQIVKGKTVPVLEEKFLRLDGSAIDVDVTAAPVIYRDRPASMVIFRDISERKHAAEALERQSEELNQRNEEIGPALPGLRLIAFRRFIQSPGTGRNDPRSCPKGIWAGQLQPVGCPARFERTAAPGYGGPVCRASEGKNLDPGWAGPGPASHPCG